MDDANSFVAVFQTSTQNITMHIKNIYEEGELEESRTCKFDLQVQIEKEIDSKLLDILKENKKDG